MDETGLMAPRAFKSALTWQEAEKRRQREHGLGGLLTSLTEPLSYIPGPVGDVAQGAANIGREGLGAGLMQTASELLLPKVMRRGPSVLHMYERGKTKPSATVREAIRRFVTGGNAERYHKDTGEFIDVAGNPLKEFSDADIMPRIAMMKELSRQIRSQGTADVTAPSKDFWYHPELYRRHPDAANVEVRFRYDPRFQHTSGTFYPLSKKIDLNIKGEDGKLPVSKWLHEMQHWMQNKQDLPQGSSFSALRNELVQHLKGAGVDDNWLMANKKAVNEAAWQRYWLTEGEIGARQVEARRLLRPAQLQESLPTRTVRTGEDLTQGGLAIPSSKRIVQPYNALELEQLAMQLLEQGPLP